jgi:hypothetical protein
LRVASCLPCCPREHRPTIASEPLAASLGRRKRPLGTIRDEAGFEFSDRGHLLKHEASGRPFNRGQVSEPDIHASL